MRLTVVGFAPALVMAAVLPVAAQGKQAQHSQKSGSASHAHHIQGDSDYVEMMLMHHKHGIEMSQAVIDRGESEEVERLARKIMEGQERDSKELEDLKRQLGGAARTEGTSGRDSAPSHSGPHSGAMKEMGDMRQKMDAQVEKLRGARGAEADRLFVAMMTRHHQQAIDMTEDVKAKLKNGDVRQLADKMVENQKKEVQELKAVK